jgi:hypothetical protein
LLPLMSWQEPLRRTRCPGHKAPMALALQAVVEAFEQHPGTRQLQPEGLADWNAGAADHAKAFQRASAAGAGRNGSLSQMQPNHRGLPMRRYQVWTVLHNFDCRVAEGTPPASRFFRRSFPALFESVWSQIDEFPLPRQRRQVIAASHGGSRGSRLKWIPHNGVLYTGIMRLIVIPEDAMYVVIASGTTIPNVSSFSSLLTV